MKTDSFRYAIVINPSKAEVFYAHSIEITNNACLILKDYVLPSDQGFQKGVYPATISPGLWMVYDREKKPIRVEFQEI